MILNPDKCVFEVSKGKFVGHFLQPELIRKDFGGDLIIRKHMKGVQHAVPARLCCALQHSSAHKWMLKACAMRTMCWTDSAHISVCMRARWRAVGT